MIHIQGIAEIRRIIMFPEITINQKPNLADTLFFIEHLLPFRISSPCHQHRSTCSCLFLCFLHGFVQGRDCKWETVCNTSQAHEQLPVGLTVFQWGNFGFHHRDYGPP